ncbi:tkl family protein kinase [Lasius niger]|uniref:Tkl family protein kinase n=1 Tax=Lasius niger TaxID=67767 RepID=A0A0J7K310_LASNI|nr:tkl family protein kinase [Lasius niger]
MEDVEDVDNHCYSAQRRLLKLMKTDIAAYEVTDSNLLVTFTDSEDDTDNTSNSEIDKFLQKIEKDSTKTDSETHPNPYYCPDFAPSAPREDAEDHRQNYGPQGEHPSSTGGDSNSPTDPANASPLHQKEGRPRDRRGNTIKPAHPRLRSAPCALTAQALLAKDPAHPRPHLALHANAPAYPRLHLAPYA